MKTLRIARKKEDFFNKTNNQMPFLMSTNSGKALKA